MKDGFFLNRFIKERSPRSAIIVGAGYVGLEMADALTHRGLAVTLISRSNPIFPTVDPSLGTIIQREIEEKGVRVLVGKTVGSIAPNDDRLIVFGPQLQERAQLVLVATGTRPSSAIAKEAGIDVGGSEAIRITHRMETNLPDILAAGDCAETWHRVLERFVYLPLGTTAHKQGRVAGENAVVGSRTFAGCVGTQTVKIFQLAVARTGLLDEEAKMEGFDGLTREIETWDHNRYYPEPRKLWIRLTGDRKTHRLLGAQIVGDWHSEVSKRIDVFATALFHRMTVEEINDLDLSYTPPFSSPWDPVQVAAQNWSSISSLKQE